MKTSTANAIKTLLRMDPTVTPEVRMSVIEAMTMPRVTDVDLEGDITISDAATYLGMSRTTLWRMCVRGDVRSAQRGHKIYILAGEVPRLKTGAA